MSEFTSTEALLKLFDYHPSVCTDSRAISPDCIFFALKGARFDGNKFAASALKQGAAYAVIDNPDVKADDRYLLVQDVLTALQDLARAYRRTFNIPVLAITGSNGKTTTKELIKSVLESHYPTHYTRGNFNNHIGVPLTLLAMPKDTEVAVIEMGANHLKEIDFLSRIAEPSHGLITNIGKAHLEGFGSEENIKIGKSELYRFLAERSGVIFVNRSEQVLTTVIPEGANVVFYETDTELKSPYGVRLVDDEPFIIAAFKALEEEAVFEVHSNLLGLYNFENIKTAISIGKYFKVPNQKIKSAIEGYIPTNNRSQVVEKGNNKIILDAYNANPSSMKAAITTFAKVKAERKVAILGAMLELGLQSELEHEEVAKTALAQNFDQILLIGKEFSTTAEKLGIPYFDNTESLKQWFEEQTYEHTHFWVKGSRGVGLERLFL